MQKELYLKYAINFISNLVLRPRIQWPKVKVPLQKKELHTRVNGEMIISDLQRKPRVLTQVTQTFPKIMQAFGEKNTESTKMLIQTRTFSSFFRKIMYPIT